MTIVKVEGLWHRYGKDWAVKDINFETNDRRVLGLLGSNGAGKSTTMNILCGVLSQTTGTVTINGTDIRKDPELAKTQLGFLPQQAPLHLDFTVDEYLVHCAYMRNIKRRDIRKAVAEVKEKCGVAHFSKRLIRNLSGGYRQRVGIAQAIIHKPKVVVLDEPTNGLDPNQILEVRHLIREIANEHAVIFSSHILSEIEATCQDIVMIEQGTMVFSDSMEAFNNYIQPQSMLIRFESPVSITELSSIAGVERVEVAGNLTFRLYATEAATLSSKVIGYCVQQGWQVAELIMERSSLHEIFAQLSRKKNL